MRRPTPTQSMNTTQRSSFIILKNPMSSTKPNPTVDTERKIYKIHSGTWHGSGDTGHSSCTSRCPRSSTGETCKQNPQDVFYVIKKCRPTWNMEGPLRYLIYQEGPCLFVVHQGGPAFQLKVRKIYTLQHPKDFPTLLKN